MGNGSKILIPNSRDNCFYYLGDGNIIRIDLPNLEKKWNRFLIDLFESIAVEKYTMIYDNGSGLYITDGRSIAGLNVGDGKNLWDTQRMPFVRGGIEMILVNNNLIIGDSEGNIGLYDSSTGEQIKKVSSGYL